MCSQALNCLFPSIRIFTKATKRDKSIMIERFIESLKGIDGPLVNWSDTIWIATIDKAVIGTNYIEFEFKNGKKKKIDINH